MGFDSDMPSIFQRQIDFIQKSGIVTAMVGMLQAPPGTRVSLTGSNGKVGFVKTFSGDNVDGTTNIIPRMGLDRAFGWVSIDYETDLFSKKLLPAVRILLKELKAPEINHTHKCFSGSFHVLSIRFPARCFGQGAFSLLATDHSGR